MPLGLSVVGGQCASIFLTIYVSALKNVLHFFEQKDGVSLRKGHILIRSATRLGHMKLPYFHTLWVVSPSLSSPLHLLPRLACLVQKKMATPLR